MRFKDRSYWLEVTRDDKDVLIDVGRKGATFLWGEIHLSDRQISLLINLLKMLQFQLRKKGAKKHG